MLLPAQEPRVPLPGQQLQGRLTACLGHGAGTLREDPDRSHSVGHLREVGRRRTPLHLLSRQNRQSLEGQRCKCSYRGYKSGDFSKMKPVHRPVFFFLLHQGVQCRTLQGHAHWVNTLALSTDYVLRTGAFEPATATVNPQDVTGSREALPAFPLTLEALKMLSLSKCFCFSPQWKN